MDAIKNFAKVTVSTGYDASATSVTLSSGEGAKLPDPSTDGAFNLTWWNSTDYPDPSDDPNVEIVRCTARSTDTLTITRAQEGTTAATHNTSGKIYKMMLGVTKKTMDDIDTSISTVSSNLSTHTSDTSNPHSVTAAQVSAVDLSSDQTIAGVKTFSSIPVLPSSDPTSDNQAVRKAYLDNLYDTYVSVKMSATQSVSYGTTTTVKFDTVAYGNSSNFDTATYTYTAPSDGLYLVLVSVRVDGQSSDSYVNVSLMNENDTAVGNAFFVHSMDSTYYYAQASNTFLYSMSANDELYVSVYCKGGGTMTINNSATYTFFSIVKLFYI